MVTAGLYDVVLAVGSEKLYCEDKQKTFSVFAGAVDFEDFDKVSEKLYKRIEDAGIKTDAGAGSKRSLFMDVYAAMALGHMRDYGTTREDFAAVSAKTNGSRESERSGRSNWLTTGPWAALRRVPPSLTTA